MLKNQKIIDKMTLDEKISFCTGKDFWHTKGIKRLGVPEIMLCDGPHGLRKQPEKADMLGVNESVPATCFPTAVTTGATWNEELMCEIGRAIGEEANKTGVSVVLGPGANIKRNPLCGRNFEYISEDPLLAGKMAAGFIRGAESTGVATSLKHFAANSREKNRFTSDSVMDARTLYEIYLRAFEIAVKEGKPSTVMCSYNKINGVHSSDNKELLTNILRDEWGFNGLTVTDWGAMSDRVKAFYAGCDLNMPGGSDYMEKDVKKAVNDGRLPEEYIDRSVDRILSLVLKNKDEDICGDKENITNASIPCDMKNAHHALAKKAAEEGMVLLKNEDNILPLKESQKIALFGNMASKPRYQGAGSSHINPTKLLIPAHVIPHETYLTVTDERGETTDDLIKEAVTAAAAADVCVVFAGLPENYESEGFDRQDMKLPLGHVSMIDAVAKKNPNTVVVLMCGSPVECDWEKNVKGIVYAGLFGQAGAEALSDILYGKVNPSGKLAESWPLKYEDCISADEFDTEKDALYKEGIYVGYRFYDSAKKDVRFPFGFGLSYTQFLYKNMRVEPIGNTEYKVTCDIENTGNVTGKEVAELYVSAADSEIFRPKKELKGFVKTEIKPGETKKVTFLLDKTSFEIWAKKKETGAQNKGKFVVPKGKYEILIGAGSRDIRLKTEIRVEGEEVQTDASQKGSWYETLNGRPSAAEFEALLGIEYTPTIRHKGEFTMEDTVEDMKNESLIMKLMYFSTKLVIKKGIGGKITQENEATYRMMLSSSAGSPIRSMAISGGIKSGIMEGLVDMANGHFFKGLGRIMGVVK